MRKISAIKRSRNQARRYYDQISKIYDWLTAGEKPLIQKGVALLGISQDERIIDIGCGTGTGLHDINEKLSQAGRSFGLDLSYQMLMESREKFGSKKSTPFLVQSDAVKLPIKSDQFDGLLCTFTLELFSIKEIPLVLNEFQRILKSSGRLVIVSMAQEPHTIAVDIYEWIHKYFPIAADCRPIPLSDLLRNGEFEIMVLETDQYWGLPIEYALCQPVK